MYTMSPKTRNTDRISASLDTAVIEELERFAYNNNESKSRVIENALIEYLEIGRYGRIEEKLDAVLASLDSGSAPSPTPSQESEENKRENEDPREDEFWYDPDEDLGRYLDSDEIHEILARDEPEIHPDHVGNSLPRDTGPRTQLLHACVRYDRSPEDHLDTIHEDEVEDLVRRVLGEGSHFQDKYVPRILNDLTELKRANDSGEVESPGLYSFDEDTTREWYSNLFQEWWEDATLDDFDDRSELSQYRTQVAAFRDQYLELDIVDEDTWKECRDNLLDLEIVRLPEGGNNE